MSDKHKDPRYQTPEELAGVHFSKLMQSKEAAMEFLSAEDYKLRLAAILVCESTWKCSAEPRVIAACRDIVVSDANDSFRICAIGGLGRALSGSKSINTSTLLANIILDSKNSNNLRINAYWSLREVQFGLSDISSDNVLKSLFGSVKAVLHDLPDKFSENQVKSTLLAQGRIPEELWNTAEDIDWDFVAQFATPK
jgi:hypothetical protein